MVDIKCELTLRLLPAVSKALLTHSPVPLHPTVSLEMLLALCAICAGQFRASPTPQVQASHS